MNIIIKAFNMWRFFRLGVKHNSCPGNQTHFRIIGTTCANAECDDVEDINSSFESKNFNSNCNKENFASLNSKHFHKTLQSQENAALKLSEKRKNAYKKFEAVANNILKESFPNQNYENIKKESKKNGKLYSDSNLKLEKNLKLVVNTEEDIEDIEFGSLSEKTKESQFIPDEPDEKTVLEPRFLAQKYGRIMLGLCKDRKIKEALHILEVEMKNKDVVPNNYCYNVLINACGKVGYAKKAFELYYQMKSRGLKVEKFAYTGLFNACANSPFKSESLNLAVTLRKQLKDKAVLLHPISYHAMIKAFGHCGDIKTAFEIVDDMVYDGHEITTETLNFLLHACLSDKETGFRHALMVWRKYRTLLISPDVYSYNLLIRCVNECGAGDPQLLSELFDDLIETSKLKGKLKKIQEKKFKRSKSHFLPTSTSALNEPDQHVETESEKDSRLKKAEESTEAFYQIGDKNEIVKVNLQPNMELELVSPEKVNSKNREELILPNVLAYRVTPGNILAISSLEKNEDRFWLLGGVSGILKSMREDRVKPTIVTFINILDSLPPTFEVEEDLLKTMENLNIKPNIIFCNKLIRKRCKRSCLEEAKDVLTFMQKHDVAMDLVTFGCLSIGCRKPSDIKQFLRDMKQNSITPNEEIMGALVLNSVKNREYALAIELLGHCKRHEVPVTEYLLNLLEETRTTIKKKMIEIELEPPETVLSRNEKRVREEMKLFLMEYKHFLKKSHVELKEHPWAQFGHSEKSKQVSKRSSS